MKPTQNELIKAHLLSGRTITSLEALRQYDCLSLAQRIANLKERGMKIKTEMVVLSNNKRIAQYELSEGNE